MRALKIAKSLVSGKPSYLIMYVTNKCNSRCRTCFIYDSLNNPNTKEMTLDEITKLTKSFKSLVYVSLTGGEPFMRTDIDQIMKAFYNNSGTIFFAIPTNGLLPDRIVEKSESVLKDCPEVRLHIDLSVDGLHDVHDYVRGVKGNFEQTLKSYEGLRKLKAIYPNNLFINVHTCFNGYNQDYIYDIIRYFEKLDAVDNHRVGMARNDSRFPEALADVEKYKKLIKFMNNSQKRPKGMLSKLFKAIHELNAEMNVQSLEEDKMILPCIAMKKMIIIGEEGDVYPCEILNRTVGNLRDYDMDINKMLSTPKSKELRKWIVDTKCHCSWGCAIQNNIIFNPSKTAPKLLAKLLKPRSKSSREDIPKSPETSKKAEEPENLLSIRSQED
ncbi:MAG TPA: radical SAM protein [Candidatus Nanoarchaeia archaeon]|nr:radical SAM protein [Candidatus Nanoarchaeia archaeon]